MVAVECRAEAMAVDEQIPARILGGLALTHGIASEAKGFADASVNAAQFMAPGDEPVRVAFSHATTKVTMRASTFLRFGASMPDTVCHRHATLDQE